MSAHAPVVRRLPGRAHAELVVSSLDEVYDLHDVDACRAGGGSRASEHGPGLVSGPFDYWYLRLLREQAGLPSPSGDVRATDVFLWSLEPSPQASATRLGGVPYLPRAHGWPRRNGVGGRFVAQLDFRDSLDLVPFVPHDVLLVFAFDFDDASSWDRRCYDFVWVDVDDAVALHASRDVPAGGIEDARPLYGTRVRSFDEPSLVARIRSEGLPHVHSVQATKIGGSPNDRQSIDPPRTPPAWRFLGQIAAQWPTNDVPYPVLAHPAPVRYLADEFHALRQGPGDGIACLYLDGDGEVQIHFSCS